MCTHRPTKTHTPLSAPTLQRNAKVQSVHLPDLPITSACFSADGTEVIASGRRPFFYVYDLKSSAIHKVPHLQGRWVGRWVVEQGDGRAAGKP